MRGRKAKEKSKVIQAGFLTFQSPTLIYEGKREAWFANGQVKSRQPIRI